MRLISSVQRLTDLRSAGHLENVPPGTAADRRYKR